MKSRLAAVTLVILTLAILNLDAQEDDTTPAVPSLDGTTWAGTDSDGDFYEYTFLKGGQVRYRTNASRDKIVTFEEKGDVWAQNGSIVLIMLNNTSAQSGTIKGNQIEGPAWNANGQRWTWQVKKK